MDGFLLCWYLLTALSIIFIIYDMVVNTPVMWVMGLAWVLVIAYTGPLGLFFYFISCRQPLPGTHDQFINVHWKQAFGSEIHCIAGDATAIIIAAAVMGFFEVPNGIEAIIEYVAAWLFGLLIFQALFMISMFPSYIAAVKHTAFSETVSMNFVMVAMIPTVLIIKSLYPPARDPGKPYFWGMMSLATILGFIIAYPMNSWLVRNGLKHGMMSRPEPQAAGHTPTTHHHGEMPAHHGHGGHHMEHAEPKKVGFGRGLWHLCWSFALLIVVVWIVSIWIPVSFG